MQTTTNETAMTIECAEPFTFRDGKVRLAWVTWRLVGDERTCIGVRELGSEPARRVGT